MLENKCLHTFREFMCCVPIWYRYKSQLIFTARCMYSAVKRGLYFWLSVSLSHTTQ